MALLKNGVDLYDRLVAFNKNATNLFIFAPYIKLPALKSLIDNSANCRAIFVRWDTKGLISGSSDLDVYPYCKDNGILLFRNERLHLKAFVDNYSKALIGSANISARALNIPASSNYNYELATVIEELDMTDRLYFSIIEQESSLITDVIYDQFVSQLPQKKELFPNESDFEIKIKSLDKNFLISALPLTYNIETLCRIYESQNYINEVELNCAIHDLALYQLPFGIPLADFKWQLKISFFNHPFIKAFLQKLDENGEMYFGTAKNWIHANCSNVPLPRKWEITENIQVLFQWIVKLGDGKYAVDRPNYSERLFSVNSII